MPFKNIILAVVTGNVCLCFSLVSYPEIADAVIKVIHVVH